jgi:hypothetical protein
MIKRAKIASNAPPLASLAVDMLASRILFCSSMLFLVSLAYAIWHNIWDVVIGTAATAATSLLNHWFLSKHAFFNFLDKLARPPTQSDCTPCAPRRVSSCSQIVRSTAAYFMTISYWALPPQHFLLVVISGSLALAAYVGYSRHHQCKTLTHVFVHFASNVGVLVYTAGLVARRQAGSVP